MTPTPGVPTPRDTDPANLPTVGRFAPTDWSAMSTDIARHFAADALATICEMPERDFAATFGMDTVEVAQREPDDFYAFRSVGSPILAVAHLDTVGLPHQRRASFANTEDGIVVHSRALDDRLGAYVILDLLPRMGIHLDVLLTVGEESGCSTAGFFDPGDHDYNWMIEFDRGGTDVVMYQYEDDDTTYLVESSGARVGDGIFSDICYLEHLGIKGFNWGVGYRDYHGPRAHAYLNDTFQMVGYFVNLYAAMADVALPHQPRTYNDGWGFGVRQSSRLDYMGWGTTWDLDDDEDPDPYDDPWPAPAPRGRGIHSVPLSNDLGL